jgi:hypothetical protein
MSKLALGIVIGFLLAATSAVAITVVLPNRTKAKAMLVVDALGQVLFSDESPAKVEVVNLNTAEVGTGRVAWSRYTGDTVVVEVPEGQRLTITDVIVATGYGSQSSNNALSDSSGVRLVLNQMNPQRYSLTSGIEFAAGEVVRWTRLGYDYVNAPATFSGYLEPAP